MEALDFLTKYGNFIYAVVIFFGGIWGTKYVPFNWDTKYKFGLFATIFALLFILFEHLAGAFSIQNGVKYLLTYTVVTSVYEIFGKTLFEKWGWTKKEGGPEK